MKRERLLTFPDNSIKNVRHTGKTKGTFVLILTNILPCLDDF